MQSRVCIRLIQNKMTICPTSFIHIIEVDLEMKSGQTGTQTKAPQDTFIICTSRKVHI